MKKQLLLFGLGIGLMFSSIAYPAHASENQNVAGANVEGTQEHLTYVEGNAHILQAGYFDIVTDDGIATIATDSFSLTSSQESAIVSALSNRQTEIDVSSYKIPKDNLKSIYSGLIDNHPELYFVQSSWSYSYNSSNYVVKIKPTYYDGLGYSKDKTAFNKAVKKALDQTSWASTDLEKILALHNYLTLHCEYDYESYQKLLAGETYDKVCHSAYGALVNGTPVCSGYALAYKYLLNQLGIECYYVTSDSMNHAWNMIKLDGKYYHIDVTWDDPVTDKFGYSRYDYFLISDKTIADSTHEHKDWVISTSGTALNLTATSTTYEDYAWIGIRSDIVKYNNNWYYTDYTKRAIIKNSNLASESTESTFYSLSSYWTNEYLDSLMLYDDYFYFPASDGIYKLSATDTSTCERFITGTSITGCVLDDYLLEYKQNGTVKTYQLADPPEPDPDEDDTTTNPPSKEPDGEIDVTAPIYSLNITNVVVPTNLGIAFNPNGAPITKKTGVTSTDQVVSLNYGILQKSSRDKTITVKFTVADENNQIVFATNEEQVKNAADDSYVLYLQAVPGTGIKVDNATPTPATTAAKLGDIEMTEDKTHAITANTDSFTFIMDKANYKVENIELGTGSDTVDNDISDKVTVTGLGSQCSNVGFTFTGSMNTNTDWSKLDKGIKLSVSYDIEDIYNANSYGLVTE